MSKRATANPPCNLAPPAWVATAAERGVHLIGGDRCEASRDEGVAAAVPFCDLGHATPFTDVGIARVLIRARAGVLADVVRLNRDTARILLVGKESRAIVAIFDLARDFDPVAATVGKLDDAQLAEEIRQRLDDSQLVVEIDERVPMVQIWLGTREAADRQGAAA